MCGGVIYESFEYWFFTNKDEFIVVRFLICYLLEGFFLVCLLIIDIWGLFFIVKCWGYWCNI